VLKEYDYRKMQRALIRLHILSTLKNRLKTDDLARQGVFMVSCGLLAGFLNYLYQLAMGFMLPQAEYGILFSLISFSMIVGMLTQTFQNATSRFTSTSRVRGSLGETKSLWVFFLRRTLVLGLVLFLILVLVTPVASTFLNLDNRWYFVVLSMTLVLSFSLPVNQGLLQGLQRFLPLGICQVLAPLIKVSLGVILVYVGLGVNGALLPLFISSVVVFGVSLFFVRDVAKARAEKSEVTGIGSYTGLTLMAIFSFGVLTNIDVILAKHYLSPESAGDYSAMSVLGRMALYIPMGIGTAMFPKTSELFDAGTDCHRVMRRALFYTLALAGLVLVSYCFFYGFAIHFAFGGKYSFLLSDLVKYGLSMVLFTLSFLLMNYFLSIKQTRVAYALLGPAFLLVTLIVCFHSSVGQFVDIMLVCGAVTLLLMLPFYVRDSRRYQS